MDSFLIGLGKFTLGCLMGGVYGFSFIFLYYVVKIVIDKIAP